MKRRSLQAIQHTMHKCSNTILGDSPNSGKSTNSMEIRKAQKGKTIKSHNLDAIEQTMHEY